MLSGTRRTLLGFIILGALSCSAQTQVNLSPTTVPGAGQAGVTNVDVTGTGYPTGTILPADTDVKLEPSAGGAEVTTKATAITTIVGTTRRISFLIPASINVANPTQYLVSVTGKTSAGTQFASANKARLTSTRGAAVSSVNPNSGIAGQTVTVDINGLFTTFVQGSTQASFGPGISVGGAPAGGFGPVAVTSETRATAQLTISSGAAAGERDVTARTGVQSATLANGFRVTTPGSGTISTLGIMPSSIPYGNSSLGRHHRHRHWHSRRRQRNASASRFLGRVLAILGTLRDNGLNGDAKASDGIFTLASTFNEFAIGPISLRVSATFNGSVNLVFSPSQR